MGGKPRSTVDDYVTLQRGTTYKGMLVGQPGPALLGLGSIEPGGGFREGSYKTYGGECPPNLMLAPGDLYVALKGATKDGKMIGSVARVPTSVPSGRLTQDTVKLEFRDGEAASHANYLYWVLRTPQYRNYCGGHATGSAVVALSRVDFLSYPVPSPTPTRRKIVSLLEDLERKIELNRRMNETLEAMARALFKSWFVDFDPVRAKAQGQTPAGMDPATAALFPSEFQDSELGEVPKGWKHVPVRDVCDGLFDGPHATPPKADSGAVFLGIKNFTPTSLNFSTIRYISEEDWPRWTKRVEPQHEDIVFTYEATLGFFALIPPNLRCCLGRRTALVRPRAEAGDSHFLFHWFTARPFQEFLFAHRQPGSTVDRIWLKDFPNYPVLQPPRECIINFEATVSQLWSRIHANQAEARTLAGIRDALLPRLLSGELSVAQAERAVEATA